MRAKVIRFEGAARHRRVAKLTGSASAATHEPRAEDALKELTDAVTMLARTRPEAVLAIARYAKHLSDDELQSSM